MPAARETVIGKFVNQILFKVDKSSINEAKSAISEVKSFATKALGVIGIGFSFTQLSSLAEEFGGINDAIRGATRELGDQSEIQQKILAFLRCIPGKCKSCGNRCARVSACGSAALIRW